MREKIFVSLAFVAGIVADVSIKTIRLFKKISEKMFLLIMVVFLAASAVFIFMCCKCSAVENKGISVNKKCELVGFEMHQVYEEV